MSILFYDLETTGFINKVSSDPEDQPGVVQIGAIKTDLKGVPIEGPFNRLVNPELKDPDMWREDAMVVSGIRPEDVENEQTLHTVLPEFAAYCLGAKYFVGYNHIEFDNVVLMVNLLRYGYEHCFPWPLIHIDVMEMAAEHLNIAGKQGRKNPKLIEIYEEVTGKKMENAHNALFDVYGTLEVFNQLGGLEALGYS